eukprot:TRINITY_DN2009_c0_g1_i1.p1 TRINITY_DN2009_c0_g1~~TRINITY_DN2009_c0_g1_i1.p1  ORF type:complete len:243 (-),score=88.56 TRINITY_DN2009_c0_g1_i1:93-821(-)
MGFFGSKSGGTRKVAIGFTVVTILLIAFSLAMPWYYDQSDASSAIFGGGANCKQFILRGWFMEYCKAYGGDDSSRCTDDNVCPKNNIISGSQKYPVRWRSRCENAIINANDKEKNAWCDLERWYDAPFALVIVALVMALGVTLISFYRGSYGSQLRTVLSFLETVLLVVAVIVFAVGNSQWLEKWKPYSAFGICQDLNKDDDTHCNKLWWSSKGFAHGPAGWYIAIAAALFAGIAQLLFMVA